MKNLQDLTGQESGAILYPDDTILICNWSSIHGIPLQFHTGLLGTCEDLQAAKRCKVPADIKLAMQEHERESGDPVSRSGFRAFKILDCIVVTQDDWA